LYDKPLGGLPSLVYEFLDILSSVRVDLAAVVLEGEQSLRASERPFRDVGF